MRVAVKQQGHGKKNNSLMKTTESKRPQQLKHEKRKKSKIRVFWQWVLLETWLGTEKGLTKLDMSKV